MINFRQLSPILLFFSVFISSYVFGDEATVSAQNLKEDYTVPILFDPAENGTQVPDPVLEYELKKNGEFTLGTVKFPLETTEISVDRFLSGKNAEYHLKFFWPGGFLTTGKIIIRTNLEQKIVFEREFDHSSTKLSGPEVGQDHEEIVLYEDEISGWGKNTPFKFCVEEYVLELRRSLCSRDLILVDGANGVEVHASTQKYTQEVRFNNSPVDLKGNVGIKYGEVTQSSARSANGAEFQLELRPVTFKVLDLIQTSNGSSIILTGEGGIPQGDGITMNGDDGWTALIPKTRPSIMFATENKILLRQDFKFSKKIPSDNMRAYLKKGTTNSSYLSEVPLHGYLPIVGKVSSTENSATNTSNQTFDWQFNASDSGQQNRRHIGLIYKDKESYVGSYSVFRGYPVEASTRLTAQTSSQGTIILGEVLATGWLERIFKNENRLFSFQRWGVSARYATSLTSPPDTQNNGANMTFSSLDAQLRYRFTPGVWNQIETFGALLPYQNVSFEGASASMMGLGAFWVKSMPSLVDKLFNKVKWFRYPKIVDAEFQYFFVPIAGSTLTTNFNLILHGKMFMKPTFFVEAAVGYKQYGYSQTSSFTLNLSTLYASIGAGFDF